MIKNALLLLAGTVILAVLELWAISEPLHTPEEIRAIDNARAAAHTH